MKNPTRRRGDAETRRKSFQASRIFSAGGTGEKKGLLAVHPPVSLSPRLRVGTAFILHPSAFILSRLHAHQVPKCIYVVAVAFLS